MKVQVRRAVAEDAAAISNVILTALRDTNSQDYAVEVIERVALSFTVESVGKLLESRYVLVACTGDEVVATASLEGEVVRSVFVMPGYQRLGIGKLLLEYILDLAQTLGLSKLSVPSSIGAEAFYLAMGFKVVEERYYEGERTIVMQFMFELG